MKIKNLMKLVNENDDLDDKIGIVMRYAQENWEDDVWMDATYELLHALAKASPAAAREWVEGNLENVEPEDRYTNQQDQDSLPTGNRPNW